jgi:hypothetical protein
MFDKGHANSWLTGQELRIGRLDKMQVFSQAHEQWRINLNTGIRESRERCPEVG